MKQISFILMWLTLLLAGCSPTKYVPVESAAVRTDTVYSMKVRVDSVFFRDSVSVMQREDTVYLTKYRDRYRVSERVDTLYQSLVDSVRVEVPYPVERELTRWERTKMDFGGPAIAVCALTVCAAVVWLARKQKKK